MAKYEPKEFIKVTFGLGDGVGQEITNLLTSGALVTLNVYIKDSQEADPRYFHMMNLLINNDGVLFIQDPAFVYIPYKEECIAGARLFSRADQESEEVALPYGGESSVEEIPWHTAPIIYATVTVGNI